MQGFLNGNLVRGDIWGILAEPTDGGSCTPSSTRVGSEELSSDTEGDQVPKAGALAKLDFARKCADGPRRSFGRAKIAGRWPLMEGALGSRTVGRRNWSGLSRNNVA